MGRRAHGARTPLVDHPQREFSTGAVHLTIVASDETGPVTLYEIAGRRNSLQ